LSIKDSQSRIQNRESKIGIIGLGYVGLPLAIEFAKQYQTIGFDINPSRISQLQNSSDLTLEVNSKELKSTTLTFTDQINKINNCDVYIISVPTPVDKFNNPDLSILKSASNLVGEIISENNIVIYESTVYPGATEEICVPILEKASGLKYNFDFYCGYSPERINPGDKERSITSITKITSGSNPEVARFIDDLYSSILTEASTHLASSISVAEAAKVIENIQRDVNIALINELSMIFKKLNIETDEVLKAASTKWNFNYFSPGLVGGHCIGIDPYYLTHKAIELGYNPEMILAGRKINENMPSFLADTTLSEIAKIGIDPTKAKIAILGLTFKEDCPDLRNTKVINIYYKLKKFTEKIVICDPYADSTEAKQKLDVELEDFENINNMDVIILAVSHKQYHLIPLSKWKNLLRTNGLIIDIKSIYSTEYFTETDFKHWRL